MRTHIKKTKSHKEELTLRFDGTLISPEAFKKAAQSFVDLLIQVTEEVSQGEKKPLWNMSVRPGSSVFVARIVSDPETKARAAKTIRAVRSGISKLDRGETNIPHFNFQALSAARELSALRGRPNSPGITTIELGNGDGRVVPITSKIAEVVRKTLGGSHHAYGSIEGKLQTISDRGTFQFVIFDAISDKGVNCFVPQEKFPAAHSAFGRRVRVEGEINYDKEGRPLSIKVAGIKVFKELKDLPPLESFKGFLDSA